MWIHSHRFLYSAFALIYLSTFVFVGSFPPPLVLLDPATCPIVPGQEMTIEISKGRSGLGLSIVGGKDTPLVSSLFTFNTITTSTFHFDMKN